MATRVCGICGADKSRSGKPFDEAGLAEHMTMVHPDGGGDPASVRLTCDICGANQSSRGKPFTRLAHVLQHKKKRHPGMDGTPPQEAEAVAPKAVKPRRARVNRSVGMAGGGGPAPRAANHVKFCPHCGFNLDVVHAAMEFVNGTT